jgi:uncharacterized damage-inducible protein DinB
LERESKLSHKVLNEVPEGKNTWKPHERSMELGYLAALIAQMPAWIAIMIATDELDFADSQQRSSLQAKASDSRAALLKLADDSYAKGKSALEGTTEQHLNGRWAFKMDGKVLAGGSRVEQIAEALTHLAHHRGQLTVYLRLLGEKVPSTYGPSGDEKVV